MNMERKFWKSLRRNFKIDSMEWIVAVNLLVNLGVIIYVAYKFRTVSAKKSDYYTDYVNGKLIMRVYKPEFEYQAIGNLKPSQIIDMGNLTIYYKWALIEFGR